jgi:hypothetical protein
MRSLVLMSEMGEHADFVEGVTSFGEKRPPHFAGISAGLHVPKSINR